jgi:thioredoxin-dependent peroxiredoxin
MTPVTFREKPVKLKGTFPLLGTKAPDFLLIDADLQSKSLKDFPGKKLLVIVPSLDTEVCSISSKKFSQEIQNKKEISFLIISADLPFAQKRFCGLEGVKNAITLSTIRDPSFQEKYGVLIQDGPLAGLCARAVLLLDQDNTVLYQELVPEITKEPSYEAVLALC